MHDPILFILTQVSNGKAFHQKDERDFAQFEDLYSLKKSGFIDFKEQEDESGKDIITPILTSKGINVLANNKA